jgi:hypothetical protein
MTRTSSRSAQQARVPVYRVEAPRASDAVARALRDAFGGEEGLPQDMIVLLCRLNRHERRVTH